MSVGPFVIRPNLSEASVRKAYRALTLALVAAAVPAVASAQSTRPFHLGGQLNFATDGSDLGVGIRYENDLNTLVRSMPNLRAVASFDLFFPGSGVTYWEINAGATYAFGTAGAPITPYAGAGLNYAHVSVDAGPPIGSVSNSEVGLNIMGGVRLRPMGNLRPFAEARLELGGGENFILTAGLMFF